VDYSYRRWATASAVFDLVRRQRPDAVQQLRQKVGLVFGFGPGNPGVNDSTYAAIGEWCQELNLRCEAIEWEIVTWFMRGGEMAEPEREPDPDHEQPYYHIPWIPGESKRQFQKRASAEFYRHKAAEERRGAVTASATVNPKHVDWFVRYQVNEQPFERIARNDRAHRQDVKRAVRSIASLIELKLRPTSPGRPPGRAGSRRPARHIVRRKSQTNR